MDLKELLEKFCLRKGLSAPLYADEGIYRLNMLPTLLLNFERAEDQQGFFVYTSVGQVAEFEEKEVLLEACCGNLFGNQTGKGSLGFWPGTRLLIYFEYFDATYLEVGPFEDQLNLFCEYHLFWVNKLAAIRSRLQESLSLHRHLQGLNERGQMKIFFA